MDRKDPIGVMVRLATQAMGTRFEFVLSGAGGEASRALQAAGEEAIAEIELWHAALSPFARSSVLSRINREALRGPVAVDADVFSLLALCQNIWRASEGAFDPAVGAIMQDAGFHPRSEADGADPHRPSDDGAGSRQGARATMGDVELDARAGRVRFVRPLSLDLGAIAKGFALDRAAELLRSLGVQNGLLHGGTSSVIALGTGESTHQARPQEHSHHSPRAGWPIAIACEGEPLVISLRDEALGVSAPRGRTVEVGAGVGEGAWADEGAGVARLGHIVDPRVGGPRAMGELKVDTAAVIGASAALADAWSTAALVLERRPRGLPGTYRAALHRRATGQTGGGWIGMGSGDEESNESEVRGAGALRVNGTKRVPAAGREPLCNEDQAVWNRPVATF